MIRIMIVDDEPLIREWLTMCLESLGFSKHMIDQASNGEEALHLLDLHTYDFIFTDITMPKIDGISLIRSIRQRDSRVQLVILTCHDNFSFARAAVKYNVHEYLMKNELCRQDIENIINSSLHSFFEKTEHGLEREYFFNSLLNDGCEEVISYKTLEEYHIPLADSPCFALALDCHEPGICTPILKNDAISHSFAFYNENHLSLFIFNLAEGKNHMQVIKEICSRILSLFTIHKHVGISRLHDSPCSLPEMLHEAVYNWEYQFFFKEETLTFHPLSTTTLFCKSVKNELNTQKESILHHFNSNDIYSYKEQLYALCNFFVENKIYNSGLLKRTLIEMIEFIESRTTLNTSNWNYEIGKISNASYLSDVLQSLDFFFQNIPKTSAVALCIKEAQEYMILHYNEQLTLKNMAQRAFLSEEYFSRLFKKETGKTFTDFLLEIRMNRAYKLLTNGNFNINEIAEMIGIPNASYFSSQFKKCYGMSPREVKR